MARRRFINFRKETAETVGVAYAAALTSGCEQAGALRRQSCEGSLSAIFIRAAGYRSGRLPATHGQGASRAGYRRRCLPRPSAIPGTNADIESWGGADLHINEARYRQPLPNHRPPVGDGAVNSVVVPGVRFQAHF